jgi:hypothetical protein
MTVDASRYADNVFYMHVTRFRDEWLDPSLKGYVAIREMHLAYDTFCVRNNIRHRKLPTPELLPELSRIGVKLGYKPGSDSEERFHRRIAFVGWRLTRKAERIIRDLKRPEIDERRYAPIRDEHVDLRAFDE